MEYKIHKIPHALQHTIRQFNKCSLPSCKNTSQCPSVQCAMKVLSEIIKFFDEVTVHIAVFMYKFKNQLLPTNFNVFFTSIKETHNYNTRLSSRMTYALPKTRTNYGIFNIRYQGAKIWNAISDNIKLLSLKQFKKKLKSSIISSY